MKESIFLSKRKESDNMTADQEFKNRPNNKERGKLLEAKKK